MNTMQGADLFASLKIFTTAFSPVPENTKNETLNCHGFELFCMVILLEILILLL